MLRCKKLYKNDSSSLTQRKPQDKKDVLHGLFHGVTDFRHGIGIQYMI